MSAEAKSTKPGRFDTARLHTLDARRAEDLARQISLAASFRNITPLRVLATSGLAASLLVIGGSAFSAKASEGPSMIKPLPGLDSGCVDHPYRSPRMSYNHTDLRAPLPLPVDKDEIILRLTETSTKRSAEAPLDEAAKLGSVKVSPDGTMLEVHDYLPGYVEGQREVSQDVNLVPEQQYTLSIEYTGSAQLFIGSIKTNSCSP